jgi:methyl-accepting chemotaxis protein
MKLTSFLKKKKSPVTAVTDLPENTPEETGTFSADCNDTGNVPAPAKNFSATLKEFQECMPEVIHDLHQLTEGSESDFMLLGIALRTVHSNVTELTQLMLGTVKRMGAEEDGGFLDKGREILDASLAEIQAHQQEVKANLERINAVMEKIEELCTTSQQIKKFAKFLRVVALNMLVEDARTIDTSVNIFSDVAQEIKELSVNISSIANDVYTNVEKARQFHRQTREEISSGISRLEILTAEIHHTVQDSARDTETLMQFSVNTIEQAGKRSREISRQVAEIVIGIQFHDNMKQRIMYLANILETILATAEIAPREEAAEIMSAKTPVPPIIQAQSEQIKDIIEEVHCVYQKNKDALQEIRREVEKLLQNLRGMASSKLNQESGALVHDPFAHLKEALTQLHDLLDRGKNLYRQLQKGAGKVTDIASNLSELLNLVRSISANTHNKAINAIIAAESQGEKGGAMKLLAWEMNELATQSDQISNEVEKIVTDIIQTTSDITNQELHGGGSEAEGKSNAISRLTQVLDDISKGYEHFRKDSESAYQRAEELKKATDTTVTSLDFFQGLSRNLSGQRDRLRDIADQADHKNIFVERNITRENPVPKKHREESQDNVILFENMKKDKKTDNCEGILDENVELF